MTSSIDQFDERFDERWETFRGHRAIDRLFYTASETADFSMLWHTFGVAQAFVRNDPWSAIAVSSALGAESALINGPVKSMFNRSRPIQETPRPFNLRQPKTSSFPSGHASAAMVAAAMLSRNGTKPLWYTAAMIVATSRVHVRIHHASDVAGGLVAGALLGAISKRVADRFLG